MAGEPAIRLGVFAAVLGVFALAELLVPRRQLTTGRPWRWLSNLALATVNTLAARLVLPLGVVGVAAVAEERGWGLLPRLALPSWLAVPLAVIVLDFVIYVQHVLFHAVPVLWRLHRVHHADLDVDVTTGVRFHPLEILLSLGIKLAAVLLLGVPALAVLVFEVLLSSTSLFGHANLKLPGRLDGLLRLLLVTPDMHRIHHSAEVPETNSNFGFNLPWWDYLLGTYRARPAAGHEAMTLGLAQLRDERQVERLPGLLALPFLGRPADESAGLSAGRRPLPAGARSASSPAAPAASSAGRRIS